MLTPEQENRLAPAMRMWLILWAAFLLSQASFLVVAWLVPVKPEAVASAKTLHLVGAVLALLAVTLLGASFLFRFGFARMSGRTGHHEPSRVLLGYQTGLVLAWAFAEAIGLFGLVLRFLGAPLGIALGFFVVAATVIAVEFPRRSEAEALIEQRP